MPSSLSSVVESTPDRASARAAVLAVVLVLSVVAQVTAPALAGPVASPQAPGASLDPVADTSADAPEPRSESLGASSAGDGATADTETVGIPTDTNDTEGQAKLREINAGLVAYYGTAFGTMTVEDAILVGAKNVDVDSQGDGRPARGSTSTPGCGNDEIYIGNQTIDFNLNTCGADDTFDIYYRSTGPDPRIELDFRATDGGIRAEGESYTSDAAIPLEGGVSDGDGGWSGNASENETANATDLQVEVQVLANGEPVPNASVEMEKFWHDYPAGNGSAVTGPDGYATFESSVGVADCHSVYIELPNFDRRVSIGCHVGGTEVSETISVTESLAPIEVRVTDQWGYARTDETVTLKQDGEPVDAAPLDATGRATFRARPGTYTVGGSFGDGGLWKTVEHGDAASQVSLEVDACSEDSIVYGPGAPTTGDEVTVRACPSVAGEDGAWDFGDGSGATGGVATHSYDQPGTYTITYVPPFADDVPASYSVPTYERTVEVGGTGATVEALSGVSNHRLSGTGTSELVSVVLETRNDPDIETVELLHDGDVFEAERVSTPVRSVESDTWSARIPGWAIDDGTTGYKELSARVVYENGTHSEETSFHVWEPGPRLDTLIGTNVEHAGHHVDFRREVLEARYEASADDLIPENVPASTGIGFGVGGEIIRDGRFDQETGAVLVESDSGFDVQVLGWHATGAAQTDFEDYEDGDVKRLRVQRFMVAGRGGPVGLPEKSAKIGPVNASLSGGFDPRFRFEFDDIPEATDSASLPAPEDAWVSIWLGVSVTGEGSATIVSVTVTGGLDVQQTYAISNPLTVPGFAADGYYADPSGSISISAGPFSSPSVAFDDFFGGEVGYGPNPDEPDWSAIGTDGDVLSSSAQSANETAETMPLTPRVVAGPAPPAGAVRPGSGATVERVTNRSLIDETPTIARTDDGSLAAWTAQRPGEPATQGQAIAVAHRENGTWSERQYVTPPDNRSHHTPVLSTAGNEALLTWSGLDTNVSDIDTYSGLIEHLQLYAARYDGSAWSEPRQVTDRDGLVQSPSAVQTDDGWRLAWTASDATGLAGATVHTATLSNGSLSNASVVGPGVSPSLDAANGSALLTYVNTTSGDVVREHLDADTPTVRYDAERPDHVVTAGDRVAWRGPNGTQIVTASNGTTRVLDTGASVWQVGNLDLTETPAGAVLTYRANRAGNRSGVIGYRVHRSGAWSAPQRATQQWTNGSVGAPAVAPAEDGFLALAGATPRVTNGTSDLVAVRQQVQPEYTLNATVAGGDTPGETASIDYAVENVGGSLDAENVTLTARANGSVQATRAVTDAISDGHANGTVAVETGPTGVVDLRLTAEGTQRAAETVRVATPELAVDDVALARPAPDRVEATVTVSNAGEAAVRNLSLSAFDGEHAIANRTIAALAAEDTATTTVAYDPATINRSTPGVLVLDREGRLPDAAFADEQFAPRATVQPLVPASPTVSEHVRYRRLPDGTVVASTIVSNDGVGALNGTLQVYREANDSQGRVANASVALGAAVNDTSRARVVDVPMQNVSEDDRLWFAVEGAGRSAMSGDAAVRDRVPSVPPATGDVAVRVTDAASGAGIANATVEVGKTFVRTNATGHAALSPTVGAHDLAVTADGYDTARRTVAVDRHDETALSIGLSGPASEADDDSSSGGVDIEPTVVVRDLTAPAETGIDEPVRVGVTVENLGSQRGSRAVTLSTRDGRLEATKTAAVGAGERETVWFTHRFGEAGTLELVAGDVTADLAVVAATTTETTTEAASGGGQPTETSPARVTTDDGTETSSGSGASPLGFGVGAAIAALLVLTGRRLVTGRR